MLIGLVSALFWLGMLGGPHCLGMCGLACMAACDASKPSARWALHAGRSTAYMLLGAAAGASVSALAGLAGQAQALRPAWTLLYAGSGLFGLAMLWTGRQPGWLGASVAPSGAAGAVGGQPVRWLQRRPLARGYATGLAWLVAPCGLLYSALLTAGLTGSAWGGALGMAGFALGTVVSMQGGLWLLRATRRWRGRAGRRGHEAWGVRASGLLIAAVALAALAMAFTGPEGAWCAPRWL